MSAVKTNPPALVWTRLVTRFACIREGDSTMHVNIDEMVAGFAVPWMACGKTNVATSIAKAIVDSYPLEAKVLTF